MLAVPSRPSRRTSAGSVKLQRHQQVAPRASLSPEVWQGSLLIVQPAWGQDAPSLPASQPLELRTRSVYFIQPTTARPGPRDARGVRTACLAHLHPEGLRHVGPAPSRDGLSLSACRLAPQGPHLNGQPAPHHTSMQQTSSLHALSPRPWCRELLPSLASS